MAAWAIGLLALGLAVLGVYGILAHITTARTQELGIRIALGATPNGIVGLVIRDALTMIVPGVAIGIVIDIAATRLLLSMIHGIGPLDPPSFVIAPALIVAAGMLASYVPARRATRTDPLQVIRSSAERTG
jgi:ABC-type antimicrobial peptide transport system permease subunit